MCKLESVDDWDVDPSFPTVTVGVRFHDIQQLRLLERCLQSVGAQSNVNVQLHVALQGMNSKSQEAVRSVLKTSLCGSGFQAIVENVPNPDGLDLRAHLLNRILEAHYHRGSANFLCFIDFDDIWFKNALSTLVEGLTSGRFGMSYADVHCADIFLSDDQVYIRGIKDFFDISKKFKSNLLDGNFLPLHSYMFNTDIIPKEKLRYDENLKRLEDFDVLLEVARNYPVSGFFRKRLIGLYNFYESKSDNLNSTHNLFSTQSDIGPDVLWEESRKVILTRHAGAPWLEFIGERWEK